MSDEWVSVGPGQQGMDALRSELESLARHPSDIRTAGAADEFLVPPYLAKLYNAPQPDSTPLAPRRRRTEGR
jgi:hypothetical protein